MDRFWTGFSKKFIELPSQGWTYARLMAELNLSKPALHLHHRVHDWHD